MTKLTSDSGASTALRIGLAATGSLALTWAAAAPAEAQSARAPLAVAPVYDPFNSFSLGIGGGWDWFRAPANVSSEDYYQSDAFSPTVTGNGGFGTLEIGKDFRFNQMVLGIYGDYAFGHKDGSASDTVETFVESCDGPCGSSNINGPQPQQIGAFDDLTTTAYLRLNTSHAVIGRLGTIVNPTTLIYGLFGYMWQDYDASFSAYSSLEEAGVTASRSGQTGGLVFGIGAEAMINADWSLKAEYRFARLGGIPSFGNENGFASVEGSFDHIDDHIVRIVASFKLH